MERSFANPWTLAALGVLAHVAQTMLHEAGGHGVACMFEGGRVEMIAPLFMRCSVAAPAIVAAGPGDERAGGGGRAS